MARESKKNIVVIVDDDTDLLKLLTMAFQSQDFGVKALNNGKSAIEYFTHEADFSTICLIILDRMLGDMDGLDVLAALREQHKTDVPVLILSVLSAEKDMIAGLKQGAVDYIAKPFSLPVLLQQANALMKKEGKGR